MTRGQYGVNDIFMPSSPGTNHPIRAKLCQNHGVNTAIDTYNFAAKLTPGHQDFFLPPPTGGLMLVPRWTAAAAAVAVLLAACSDTAETSSAGGASSVPTPGITATELHVGVVYPTGWEQAGKDSGASSGEVGNMKNYYEAMFEQVNRSGGIFGRTIVGHYREADVFAPDPAALEQSNCAALTDDAEVAVVLAPNRQTDNFRSCFERKGVAYIGWGGSSASDDRVFEDFPHYVEAGSLSMNRYVPLLVDHLVDEGFLKRDNTIGVVLYDSPPYVRALDDALKPALAEHGLKVTEESRVLMAQTAGELGASNSAVQNAIVKFKGKKVDRVLFLQSGVVVPYLFMAGAMNQDYKPRYAVTSNEGLMTIVKQVQPAAFEGSMGLGWIPSSDQGEGQWEPTGAEKRCLDTVRKAGVNLPDQLTQLTAMAVCDQVTVMAAAFEKGGKDLSSTSFIAGLER